MVRRKEVPSLKHFCVKALPRFITNQVRRMAHKASAMIWYEVFHGNFNVERMDIVRKQVSAFKDFILENVIWYDHEDVFKALLRGIEEAVSKTRTGWSMASDMTQYRQEMEAMSAFTEIVLIPCLRRLNFLFVPASLRTRIVENLHTFTELRVLTITSGAGGQWMFKSVAKTISLGIGALTKLHTFSCKHDCSLDILESLSLTCRDSLKILDLESSKGVDDKALPHLTMLVQLEELNIFNTKLSDESKARIIMCLPKLTRLVRADFLCDALGWIDYLEEMDDPKFLLTEFFPSQQYFFHEEWQIEMAARMCPFINKMFFIFHESCVSNLMVLTSFEYLTDLCLFGGNFYKDRLQDLMEQSGFNLTRLHLISVFKVDYKAIANISIFCPNLKALGLSNCDLGEFRLMGDPNSDSEYERRQAFIAMATEAHATVQIMINLEELVVSSPCKAVYLSFLIGRCPNVKSLSLGKATEMSDDVLLKIYAQHGLEKLEDFHCEHSGPRGLTLRSISLLLNNCDQLKSIGDLQNWAGVTPTEVGSFRQQCHEENLLLDTSSHQKLRRYLQMRDTERKSYVNEIAGPTLERIRLAQRAREQQDN